MSRFTLTDDHVHRYLNGESTPSEIGRELGCSNVTVIKLLTKRGVDTSRIRRRSGRRIIELPPDVADATRRGQLTIEEVAERIGCSWSGAQSVLRRHGLLPGVGSWSESRRAKKSAELRQRVAETGESVGGRAWTPEEDALLTQFSTSELVTRLQRTQLSIRKRRARLGVKLPIQEKSPPPPRVPVARPPRIRCRRHDSYIVASINSGKSQREIAELLGVSPQRVSQIVKRIRSESREGFPVELPDPDGNGV